MESMLASPSFIKARFEAVNPVMQGKLPSVQIEAILALTLYRYLTLPHSLAY